jgi:hypothetical protein
MRAQNIGLQYLISEKCEAALEKIMKFVIPYERLDRKYTDLRRFIPHLKAAALETFNGFLGVAE